MTAKNPTQEMRQSFRCAVEETRQRCLLYIGEQVKEARLFDESAGGFSVLVENADGMHDGQMAAIRTDNGAFSVQIIHIREIKTPVEAGKELPDKHVAPFVPDDKWPEVGEVWIDDKEPSPDEDEEPAETAETAAKRRWRYRIGLSRIEEIIPPDNVSLSMLSEDLQHRFGERSFHGVQILGLLLALAVTLVPLIWVKTGWLGGQWKTKESSPWENATVKPVKRTSPLNGAELIKKAHSLITPESPFEERPAFGPSGSMFDADGKSAFAADGFDKGGGSGNQGVPFKNAWRQLHDAASKLPGAMAMTIPDVVAKLQLTKDQRKQIQQIVDATADAMSDLDDLMHGMSREDISRFRAELLEKSRQDAENVLTEEQRAAWKKISGDQ